MYKFRFKKWGLAKNLKNDQEEEIRVQAASGGIPAVPLIRGRVPGSKRLKRYVNRLAPESVPQYASEPLTRGASGSPTNGSRSGNHNSSSRNGTGTCAHHIDRSARRVQTQGHEASLGDALTAQNHGLLHPPARRQLRIPVLLDPPDELRLTQQSLRAVLDYTSNRVQKGVWDPTGAAYEAEDHAENWHNKVFEATGIIQRGRYRDGFRLLDICYRNYTTQLEHEHPLLVIETYTSVLHLTQVDPTLGASLVRYLAGLCRIRLGAGHPFARFWAALQAMGPAQVRRAVGAVTQAQFALLEEHFRPGAEFLIIQNVDSARTLREAGCIPLAAAEAIIERAVRRRRLAADRPGANDFVCWARIVLSLVFFRAGRRDRAAPVLDAVGVHIREVSAASAPPAPGDGITLFTQHEYRSMRAHMLRARLADAEAAAAWNEDRSEIGNVEVDPGAARADLAACLRERLDFCVGSPGIGPGHHYATRAFAELDELYRRAGDVAAAERLRADFDFAARWEEVCQRAESGGDAGASGDGTSAVGNPPILAPVGAESPFFVPVAV